MLTVIHACESPVLSVLICTLPERVDKLNCLLDCLLEQVKKTGLVEIITENQPRGAITTGAKRNILLSSAKGAYSAYIDDDDSISERYLEIILDAIKEGKDCVGIVGKIVGGKNSGWTFRHSITVSNWCRDKHRGIYFRYPNHLNPIKTDIAKTVPFPDITVGEDKGWSDAIKPLLKTETFIEEVIYFYNM